MRGATADANGADATLANDGGTRTDADEGTGAVTVAEIVDSQNHISSESQTSFRATKAKMAERRAQEMADKGLAAAARVQSQLA